jgi:hypothetical protein
MAEPARAASALDFGRCFTFVTADPDWVKKVLIGGAFTLASIFLVGFFFVSGYCAQVVRRVAAGEERPLPEWDDLGGLFGEGVRLVGLYFAYGLGFVVVLALTAFPAFLFVWGASGGSASRRGAEGPAAALAMFAILSVYAVILLVSVALNAFLPAAAVRVIFKGRLTAGFEIGPAIAFIRANLGNYILCLLAYMLASFAAQFGFVLCCIGVFPALFWGYLALAHGLGQTVRANPDSVG